MSKWQIDGEWLLGLSERGHQRTRLARIVRGGLALYDKISRSEIVLTASDLDVILRARADASVAVSSADPELHLSE